ncbi:hypothetical protein HYQ45_000291 [Verticillium longisporum]|uniref:DUF1996 domain-containing protein n=1 Tax=Verticillium longisporum TaxID=100787 RepID=A0A8I3AX71_VERLO|nr:hypothetical protein HYQ44_009010 [Verticillium longisporum]KAG7143499.1 hypothetical protein HYQ45_000291 [Verticillium longisporum]
MQSLALFLAGAGVANAYTIAVAERFMYKNIDPIVVPGQYTSHMHSFFGSDAVAVNTTTSKELQAGCSTAENPNDFSSYWVPTLFVRNESGATPVPFSRFSAYYVSIENAEVAIPQDYKAVAGKSSATKQADVEPLAGIEWFCENGPAKADGAGKAAFPTKTCGTHLQTLLLFHDCVNEDTLESTYSGTQNWVSWGVPANRCPVGMKRMPQLRFSIRYDLRRLLPNGWTGAPPLELACGSGVDGPNGKYNAGSVCGAKNAKDADPKNGTSDYEKSRKILGLRSVTQAVRNLARRRKTRRGVAGY